MHKKIMLFCTGLSGSGKSYFVEHNLPAGLFYNLKSATTRPMRDGESEGAPYYFVDESYFDKTRMATRLFVNAAQWQPGKPKWLYGVPEFEVFAHTGHNMVYDVIEPKYVRQMIDWFCANGLDKLYRFRVAYFIAPENDFKVAVSRANMPDDILVRKTNTCTVRDFIDVKVNVDYVMRPLSGRISPKFDFLIKSLQQSR